MNREVLEREFPKERIKQRKGRSGALLDYIEGHAIIARLNEAFEGQWSFEVYDHQILKEMDEVLVLGKLSAGDITKMQFGSSQITRDRESNEIVSLGDDFKAASTDALKKCATLLGVGLYLYADDGDGASRPEGKGRNERPPKGNASTGGDRSGAPLSDAQLRAVYAIGKSRKLTDEQIVEKAMEAFGTPPEMLSLKEASALIMKLKAL
jgi:hypothetical protein